MVVPSALLQKLICDVTRFWRNFGPLGNFLRTPLDVAQALVPETESLTKAETDTWNMEKEAWDTKVFSSFFMGLPKKWSVKFKSFPFVKMHAFLPTYLVFHSPKTRPKANELSHWRLTKSFWCLEIENETETYRRGSRLWDSPTAGYTTETAT